MCLNWEMFPRAAVLLLLATLPLASAAEWKGDASVRFSGTSTLHDWEGLAPALPFRAEVGGEGATPSRLRAMVRLPVAGMDTANADRDENLRKVMRAPEHPEILARAEVLAADGRLPDTVRLELVVLGQSREVVARATGWSVSADRVAVDLEFPVSLDAWGIERPSFLMFIRVGDEVRVRVRVVLSKP